MGQPKWYISEAEGGECNHRWWKGWGYGAAAPPDNLKFKGA